MSDAEREMVEVEEDPWDDEPSVDGEPLPLARYAFITAALSEGYTLLEVLDREGLSEAEWEATEDHWVDALEESAETALTLHDELDRAMAAARARFARKVPPLDTDVAAFVAFQRHVLAAPRLLPFLSEYGLFFGDWVRLQEAWAERMSADPEMRAAAGRAIAEAEMPALPKIEPGPRVWPAEPGGREGAAGRPAGVQRGKPAVRVVEAAGEPAAEELEWGLSGIRGEIDVRVAEVPEPARAAVGRPPEALGEVPAVPAPPPPASPPDAAQLPSFMRRAMQQASEAIEKSARISAAAARPDDPPITAEPTTLDAQPSPLKGVLPFQRPAAVPSNPKNVLPPPAARPAAPDDAPHSERTLDEDEATELAQRAAARAALPFMPVPGPKGILIQPRESAPPPPATPGSPAPATPGLPALASPPVTASPPAGAPAPAPVPDLTLGQYASLCAELGAFPDAAEEVFARYGLASVHVRMQVDLLWRERLRGDPALHARWQNLYDQHTARIK